MPQRVTGEREVRVPQYLERRLEVRAEDVDSEARTLELSFSSEARVERCWGVEILDHTPGSVRMERLRSEGPLLFNHDPSQHLGRVIDAKVVGRRGVATVRFSRSSEAEQRLQDVRDGILTAVSVRYVIHRVVLEEETEGVETYRILDWEPVEVSLVTIPADVTVGVGRSGEPGEDSPETKTLKIERSMPPEEQNPPQEPAAPPAESEQRSATSPAPQPRPRASVNEDQVRQAERQRMRDIRTLGQQHNQRELADKAIDEGTSVDQFRMQLLQALGNARPVRTADTQIEVSERELGRYSLRRAIALAMSGRPVDGIEGELSREFSQRTHREPEGFFVPPEVLNYARRDLSATGGTNGSEGGATIQTTLTSFIDVLRNRMLVRRMGATVLDGLQGNLAIPKQSGGATAYWLSENAEVQKSGMAFGQVPMTPKRLAALSVMSKQLLLQSSLSVESLVRNDINLALALALDLAALNGNGEDNQPKGVLHADNHSVISAGTDGAALTWALIVALETAIAAENADIGTLGYATNSKVRGALKTTEKAEGTAQFVWTDSSEAGFGQLNGYRAGVSNQVPSNLTKGSGTGLSALIYGNWADLVIGLWGGMDVVVDPYTLAAMNQVRIVANTLADVIVRRKESFAAIEDAVTG